MADTLPEGSSHHVEADADAPSRPARQRQNSVDKDAQEMVIASLRNQVQDLFSQVSELNNKLVKSYDRVSDLEDDLHIASANVRSSSVKISQLELERTQHLSALNTGLLVEKTHVTAELNRLMEKATEEAAQRGQAESARMAIEKDLDDLSATLFGQANSMVAEARYDKHLSERKVEDAERALKSAEEAVQLMQTQMQTMQSENEEAQQKMREMQLVMGKGKWVATEDDGNAVSWHLISTHAPYQEYLSFIAHLRVLHPSSPSPPAMATLLQLPFLVRLLTEDSEPTVRLDLAPSLNWLSRRNVMTAIHSGQLTIEPVSATSLFAESSIYVSSSTVAGMNSTHDNISCALCGVPIFPVAASVSSSRSNPITNLSQSSWSGSFFKKSLSGSSSGTPTSPTQSERRNSIGAYLNSQVFIFRMPSLPTTSAIASSLPLTSMAKSSSQSSSGPSSIYGGSAAASYSTTPNNQPTTIYPLCLSGWCLHRLRTTCTLWAFVRTGIVDKVWEEEIPLPPPPPMIPVERSNSSEKPPVPPRKRGLWGIASAIGERAASWSGDEKDKLKKAAGTNPVVPTATAPTHVRDSSSTHTLPAPPPVHPSIAHPPQPPPRRMPPPPPPRTAVDAVAVKPGGAPPPLPRRNDSRTRSVIGHLPSPPPEADAPSSPTASAPIPEAQAQVHGEAQPEVPSAAPEPAQEDGRSTPANLPLPDSRPATPTPAGPSRVGSPAVVGTATPPPLPRRAAARARPVSSRPATPARVEELVLGAGAGVTVAESAAAATATPIEGATAASAETPAAELSEHEKVTDGDKGAEDKKDAVVDEVKAEKSEVDSYGQVESIEAKHLEGVAGEPTEPPSPLEEEKDVDEKAEEQNDEDKVEENHEGSEGVPSAPHLDRSMSMDTTTSGSDVFEDALTPDSTPTEKKDELEEQEQEEDDKATIVERSASEESAPATDVPELAEEPTDVPVISEPEFMEVSPLVNGAHEPEKSKLDEQEEEEKKRQRQQERERLGYISDRTWEERTWKELIRLREDMFYARVGRFRD